MEIKCFVGYSAMDDLGEALSQYLMYGGERLWLAYEATPTHQPGTHGRQAGHSVLAKQEKEKRALFFLVRSNGSMQLSWDPPVLDSGGARYNPEEVACLTSLWQTPSPK